jgi:antitoxin (DNA-binding transcriptional repressor) of toxin-antitoxin stability system
MTSVTIEEAQAMLPDIVRQLQPGEEITITDHEQPLAQMRKASRTSWPCKAGSAKQSILRIAPDFDAPLDELREYME